MASHEKFSVQLALVLPGAEVESALEMLGGPTYAPWKTARALHGEIARLAFDKLPPEPAAGEVKLALISAASELQTRAGIVHPILPIASTWNDKQALAFIENSYELAPDRALGGERSAISAPRILPPPSSVLDRTFQLGGVEWAEKHWGTQVHPRASAPHIIERPSNEVAAHFTYECVGGRGAPLAAAISELIVGARVRLIAISMVDGSTCSMKFVQGRCIQESQVKAQPLPASIGAFGRSGHLAQGQHARKPAHGA